MMKLEEIILLQIHIYQLISRLIISLRTTTVFIFAIWQEIW
jgi:hypothetical protein